MTAFLPLALSAFLLSVSFAHADPVTELTLRIAPNCHPQKAGEKTPTLAPVNVLRLGHDPYCAKFEPRWGLEGFEYFDRDGEGLKIKQHQAPTDYATSLFDSRMNTPFTISHTSGVYVYRSSR